MDGTKNNQGTLKYYCWLKVKVGKREEKMMFFLTRLGKERFILGYPFFWAFDPQMDWRKGQVLDGKISIETLSFRKAQDRLEEIQEKALKEHGRPAEGQALYIRKTTTSQKWAHQAKDARAEEAGRDIPNEYRRHWQIFNETLAERYPPKRSEDLRIKLHENAPKTINCKVYPLNRQETDILQTFLAEEERKGYIKPGNSPYTAPVFFVGKKDSKELRPVMDYREINKWTVRDNNTLPNIQTALENLQGGELFSKFDLRWGYKNLRIHPEDQEKAAFKTIFGVYVPNVTYFGLTNAPPTFQRVLQTDLQPLLQKYPKEFGNYLDDVWIVTKKNQQGTELHRKITHELFDLLEEKSYFLKLSKSQFEVQEMDLLGWKVGNGEIRIDPDKIAGLQDWPTVLKDLKQLRTTLGITGYHRRFVKGYAEIAKPLTELTKKDVPFEWTNQHTKAVETLIKIITSGPVLKCPDPEKPFELEVDASSFAIGAVLIQKDEQGVDRQVGYFSKALTSTERNYNIWDREFMSIIWGLRNWRHLLQGSPHPVIVKTDHANLQYYRHPQKINRRVARYISTLADFNIKLQHLPGTKNRADPLSRRPDYDDGTGDNEQVTALPDELFARVMETTALDQQVRRQQRSDENQILEWQKRYQDIRKDDGEWRKGCALVVTRPKEIEKDLVEHYHDSNTGGHLGIERTYQQIVRDYWWLNLQKFVHAYVQGCGTCQQNKTIT